MISAEPTAACLDRDLLLDILLQLIIMCVSEVFASVVARKLLICSNYSREDKIKKKRGGGEVGRGVVRERN